MDLFNTPWAAISFIDKDFEIAKAELGYGRQFIRRSESIGAHVLLTQDVMAINDTSQVSLLSIIPRMRYLMVRRTGDFLVIL